MRTEFKPFLDASCLSLFVGHSSRYSIEFFLNGGTFPFRRVACLASYMTPLMRTHKIWHLVFAR